MIDQAKHFEMAVLRPLQIVFLASTVIFLFKSMWWWSAGCVACVIYLGIIGSKLHPFQSVSDLAKGPIGGTKSQIESELIPPEMKRVLIGHACTRVGILLGIMVGVISWAGFGWRWYFAVLVVMFVLLLTGSLLKLAFKTI